MPTGLPSGMETGETSDQAAEVIWFLHGGGLPLPAVAAQLRATTVLGTPMSYFDHSTVMFGKAKALGVRSFQAYVNALFAEGSKPFSAFIAIDDLPWLDQESALFDRFHRSATFVHLCFRDPVLQAICLAAGDGPLPPMDEGDNAGFKRIADALITLEDREATAQAWLRGRDKQAPDLMIEDLAAPGVASLRHLLDDWSLTLPPEASIQPIQLPSLACQGLADAFRTEAENRSWRQAVAKRPPHWRQRMGSSDHPGIRR